MDGAVQRTDSAIGFPNIYPLDSDLLYPMDSAMQLLNNWGLLGSVMGRDYFEISGYVVRKILSQIKPVVSLVWFRTLRLFSSFNYSMEPTREILAQTEKGFCLQQIYH